MKKRYGIAAGLLTSLLSLSRVCSAATAEEALQDIDRHVCKRQDEVTLPDNSRGLPANLAPRTVAPDLACALDVEKVASLAGESGTVIVDTRTAPEFDRFHINGAINLDAGSVRTRSFLARRKVMLVGNGKGEQELYSQCARLRKNGFPNTHVLRGGMLAWTAAELSVVGTPLAVPEMANLSAAELLEEDSGGVNRTFVMPAVKGLRKHMPDAVLLPDNDVLNMVSAVRKSLAAPGAPRVASVVIATGRPLNAGQLAEATAALSPWPVLFYMEDEKAYERFLTTQKAVWTAQARGPKLPPCAGF